METIFELTKRRNPQSSRKFIKSMQGTRPKKTYNSGKRHQEFKDENIIEEGAFEGTRRRNIKDGSTTFKLIKVDDVVSWVDKAMEKMKNKRSLIIKSFQICGLSVKLDGSEDHLIHNYEYLKQKIEK